MINLGTNFLKTSLICFGLCIPMVTTNPATAAEMYRLELKESISPISTRLAGEKFKRVRGESEWVVMQVSEPGIVQFQHLRRINKTYVASSWIKNPVTALLACPIVTGACTNSSGNQFVLPKSKTVKDFWFELQFMENDIQQVRSVQVPINQLPEVLAKPTVKSTLTKPTAKSTVTTKL